MIIIQKHLGFYGNIVEMSRLNMMMVKFLSLLQLMPLLIHLKLKILTGQTGDNDRTDVEKMLPFKYISNFWRTL